MTKFVQRLRGRLSREWSAWSWQRELAALRGQPNPQADKRVLFCDLMTMMASAKVEALMAGFLRTKGYRAVVLLDQPDRFIEQIFRAAAPDAEFVYRREEISAAESEAAAAQARSIMADCVSLQDLVTLEIDGYRIGRNVQSMVLRTFRVGRLDDADPRHREVATEVLARSLATMSFAERLMKARTPDAAVFVERGYTPAGEMFDGCVRHGVDVIQWCSAPQSDCLIYRRYNKATRAEHPLALSDEMWARLQAMPWTDAENEKVVNRISANYKSGAWYNRQQLQDGKQLTPADELRRQLGLDSKKKTVVLFCHILYDATFFYGDSLYDDYEQWMIETVRAAIANPNLNWIVKVHPANVWRSKMDGEPLVQLEAEALRKAFGELPDHVKIMPADTGINTFSLFDTIDYGLTVRGTIGMELPCFGIPVVTAGTGRYSGRGFTMDPASRADYAALLARLHEVPRLNQEEIRLARLHYYGALELRPVPMKSFLIEYPAAQAGKRAQADVVLSRELDETALESPDLGRFARWVSERSSPELLARDQ